MIDLRSDTVTMPTDMMMQSIMNAQMGDDVYGEDISTNRLEDYAADLMGKEAGLFVTSGTMGNLIALLTHTQHRRSEIIAETKSHIVDYEGGNISHFGGVAIRSLDGIRGYFSPAQVESAIRNPKNLHHPITSLICIENTHANAGGAIIKPEQISAIRAIANKHNIPMHLDGARIFNASVALNKSAESLVKDFDSVQFCLSKGLSAPIGSMLVGSRDFIDEARHYRKMLGGGMRQVGIITSAGIVALDSMIDRLEEDHYNAKLLANGLAEIEGFEIDMQAIETNIVCVNVEKTTKNSDYFVEKFSKAGVLCLSRGNSLLRFILRRHISTSDVKSAIEIMKLETR